jgi:hypothetical protein
LSATVAQGRSEVNAAYTWQATPKVPGPSVGDGFTISTEKKRGQDTSAKQRWTDTFVKEDGRWRAVFTHHVELK